MKPVEIKESVEECTRYTFDTFSENQNDCYLFDSKDNKIGKDSISFPVVVGWKSFFKPFSDEDGDWIPDWGIAEDEETFKTMMKALVDYSFEHYPYIDPQLLRTSISDIFPVL